ncbi:hypothetical protein [Marinilabilia sp.]|uniref:hypothetical protein n=1 Tax=Marinilabilia sp. TaxID=2021252 RepID=UPI0025BFFDED|nr:hypothetical protein [Marinilabilia sp.]
MKPKSKLLINLTGDKSYYLWNGTDSYYDKLRSAYMDIKNDNISDYLLFGFFTLCSATLEYSLNYILADYSVDKFGPENYKSYCREYIGLSFRNKLLMIPHIISDGKYQMNDEATSFKTLEELIILRNKIMHNKEFLKEFDLPINGELLEDKVYIPLDKSKWDFKINIADNYIDTLTKEKCLKFGDALGEFKKYIMTPALSKKLNVNEMILKH